MQPLLLLQAQQQQQTGRGLATRSLLLLLLLLRVGLLVVVGVEAAAWLLLWTHESCLGDSVQAWGPCVLAARQLKRQQQQHQGQRLRQAAAAAAYQRSCGVLQPVMPPLLVAAVAQPPLLPLLPQRLSVLPLGASLIGGGRPKSGKSGSQRPGPGQGCPGNPVVPYLPYQQKT
jgi:hypothetical protein